MMWILIAAVIVSVIIAQDAKLATEEELAQQRQMTTTDTCIAVGLGSMAPLAFLCAVVFCVIPEWRAARRKRKEKQEREWIEMGELSMTPTEWSDYKERMWRQKEKGGA